MYSNSQPGQVPGTSTSTWYGKNEKIRLKEEEKGKLLLLYQVPGSNVANSTSCCPLLVLSL